MDRCFLGLDVGGTKCAVSLASVRADAVKAGDIVFLDRREFPTPKRDPQAALKRFSAEIDAALAAADLKYADVAAIGISCGGPLDSRRGVIQSPPNLPGWDDVEIVSYFEKTTGVRTFLQNDANACAVAEWRFGAGAGTRDMLFLTFGTGLGAGLILDGRLYSGANDMAGEIGHVRLRRTGPVGYGKAGSAEGFCSGGGIAQLGAQAVRRAVENGEHPKLLDTAGSADTVTAKQIAALAREGDAMCLGIYKKVGAYLGETLAILIDLLNPERIVLGGVFMRAGDLIRPEMERILHREALPHARKICEILPAGLGESVGDYAAIAVAVNSV